MPAHHAILIGIDAYPEEPLRGAVRDVQGLRVYLENLSISVQIRTFTATFADASSQGLLEDPQSWPTPDNIQRAIHETTRSAGSGDFVYIHYSGHGTREKPGSRTYNESTGDLALVLLSRENPRQVSYLFGRSLAYSINDMVKKGLVVTLVLDCCFSASVYRVGEPGIRFLIYDDATALRSPRITSTSQDTIDLPRADRDVSATPNWLIHPDKYAVLVSCGPDDETGEIRVKNDGQIYGTLSYLLLQVLKSDGDIKETHKTLYERLRAEIQRLQLSHHPILYGDKNQGFFGNPRSTISTSAIMVIRNTHGVLELQAGQAQGIHDGDQFTLEAIGVSESQSESSLAIASVGHAGGFTSNLVPLIMPILPGRTTWRAVPLIQQALKGFTIRLSSSLPHQQEWMQTLNDGLLDVHGDIEGDTFAYELTLNGQEEYIILDASGHEINNMPILPVLKTSPGHIRHILEHMARFRLARELKNISAPTDFQDSFNISIVSDTQSFGPGSKIEVTHGKIVQLVFENRGSRPLYIAMYDLGPYWQVENVYRSTYEVVLPMDLDRGFTGCFRPKLRKIIPDCMKNRGHSSCDDILKIFITSHPTSFDFLELPELGGTSHIKPSERGEEVEGVSENWTTEEFFIRVVERKSTSR